MTRKLKAACAISKLEFCFHSSIADIVIRNPIQGSHTKYTKLIVYENNYRPLEVCSVFRFYIVLIFKLYCHSLQTATPRILFIEIEFLYISVAVFMSSTVNIFWGVTRGREQTEEKKVTEYISVLATSLNPPNHHHNNHLNIWLYSRANEDQKSRDSSHTFVICRRRLWRWVVSYWERLTQFRLLCETQVLQHLKVSHMWEQWDEINAIV